MGLFKKKKKEEKEKIPEFPELPKLPELPEMKGEFGEASLKSLHQLPSFPNNSLGEKFSQDTIKEAVAGKKEGGGVFHADDFAEEEMQMMQKPQRKTMTKEISRNYREVDKTKHMEPVFIRLDKFEESLNIFEKMKKQISEIENMLGNTKRVKEEEEKELEFWEKEMQTIKTQIEKIDRDIFSKIE